MFPRDFGNHCFGLGILALISGLKVSRQETPYAHQPRADVRAQVRLYLTTPSGDEGAGIIVSTFQLSKPAFGKASTLL